MQLSLFAHNLYFNTFTMCSVTIYALIFEAVLGGGGGINHI
jgi:hypothetical protein